VKFHFLSIERESLFMHVTTENILFLFERQLESVYLHIIIHGKEIQTRIANLKK
jgi:hypothetical protein